MLGPVQGIDDKGEVSTAAQTLIISKMILLSKSLKLLFLSVTTTSKNSLQIV